jgi:response regulator RpfG family c-di-GMP phosphodiesterase
VTASARRVLIVDDERDIRTTLHAVFGSAGYECRMAGDGREAARLFEAERAPLTITDLKMPVMDGLQLLQHLKARDADAAVIVLTGAADVRTAVESPRRQTHPGRSPDRPASAEREHRSGASPERRSQMPWSRVSEATATWPPPRRAQQTHQATRALGSVLPPARSAPAALLPRAYSLALARSHGVPTLELDALGRGVLLHDIGKIGIPDAILLKPGPLTPDEWAIMRSHPEIGRQILESIPFLRDAIPVVRHHHERWDGTGYPFGLTGPAIPLGARIFAVADAFDAMTYDRPYSKAISLEAARDRIRDSAGTHFDPDVVGTFLRMPLEVFAEARARALDAAR